MSSPPYPAPAACVEPSLGAEATQALGAEPPAGVAEHLAVCAACRVQRAAFEELEEGAVAPPAGLGARVRGAVMARRRARSFA